MTNFDTLDKMNTNFVTLSDQELMETDGGLIPIVIGGVVIGWKAIGITAAVIGGSMAVGAAAGYYANRP